MRINIYSTNIDKNKIKLKFKNKFRIEGIKSPAFFAGLFLAVRMAACSHLLLLPHRLLKALNLLHKFCV